MNSIATRDPSLDKIHALIDSAASLTDAQRDAFLRQEFADDAELRQQIFDRLSALLKNHHEGSFDPITGDDINDVRTDLLGQILGDYRLKSVIGSGGTGTVYLSERADAAYSSEVAVKVLNRSSLSSEARQRFVSERQILANLNHPYIARLMDGGETRTKESFLVMEYVNGQPIDRYCDQHTLTITQRLKLFIKVCEAVQFAHRNLIIHRDLKPGNMLIANDGTPKLLDFGIAKLLKRDDKIVMDDPSPHTRVLHRMLTPEYASPEQIRGQQVTTASDVYSLGVILYELLTGIRPYEVNSLTSLDMERSICMMDPIKPSEMIEKLSEDTSRSQNHASIASNRKTTFKKLMIQLDGDLDSIIMRALRKEPELRYSSVEQLMEDIQRHLNQEPVFARQGNWAYYSSRFMRRHALGAAMSSIALIALVGFAVAMSIQAKRIAEQRDKATQESARAESVSNFLQEIFTAADPYQSQDKQVTAKDLLDKAAQRINNDISQQGEVRARLLEAIGNAYGSQEQFAQSIRFLEDALRIEKQLPNQNKLRIARVLSKLGRAQQETGNFQSARNALLEARQLLESEGNTSTSEFVQILTESGGLEHRLSNLVAAQKYYERGLELSRKLNGNLHPETANMLIQLAQVLTWESKYAEAEKLTREATSIMHTTLPEKHPDRINADMSLAEILFRSNHLPEAEEMVSSGLRAQVDVFGKHNYRLIDSYNTLSKIHLAQSRFELAERDAKSAVEISSSNFGNSNFNTGIAIAGFANVLLKERKFQLAESQAQSAVTILQSTASPDHQYVASAEYLLGASLVGQHKSKEAEPMLLENMARWKRAEAPAWRAARTESVLGHTLVQLRKPKEAAVALNHAYEVLSAKDSGADADTISVTKKRLDELNQCFAEHREQRCTLSE